MSKNMSKKNRTESSKETENLFPRREEVPPVIIKGGSLQVRFPDVDFDDPDNHSKVKKANHPTANIKILRVEIRDNRDGQDDKLLCYFDARDVTGKIDIIIYAQ
jgi:hypothetical protein